MSARIQILSLAGSEAVLNSINRIKWSSFVRAVNTNPSLPCQQLEGCCRLFGPLMLHCEDCEAVVTLKLAESLALEASLESGLESLGTEERA